MFTENHRLSSKSGGLSKTTLNTRGGITTFCIKDCLPRRLTKNLTTIQSEIWGQTPKQDDSLELEEA